MSHVTDTSRTAGSGMASAVFTVDEAAQYLRISRAYLYRLFSRGDLKPARIGGRTLVRRVDADALLERAVSGAN